MPFILRQDRSSYVAFPGDLVGLGFLEHHTELALAVGDAFIECLPRDEQEKLAAIDQSYRDQLDAATEKEFEHQRVRLTGAAAQSPIARVASYLLAVSTINMREGMDPNIVEEPSAPAASYLQITADQLTHSIALSDPGPDQAGRFESTEHKRFGPPPKYCRREHRKGSGMQVGK